MMIFLREAFSWGAEKNKIHLRIDAQMKRGHEEGDRCQSSRPNPEKGKVTLPRLSPLRKGGEPWYLQPPQ